jgi:hypothetical protein
MKATELILEASQTLRAAAEQLQDEARARRARGELSRLDVVDIRRQCVQPLLEAAATLLVARDAQLADQLELHIDALDGAVLGISAAVAQTSALFDLFTFGGHLAGAARAIVALVNEADPSRFGDVVTELSSAVAMLNSDGDLI